MNPIRTAILPVAGLGTRLLPATKAVPKELLPVYDTPIIQFALDEIAAAGIERLVVVSHHSKESLKTYIDENTDLLADLRRKGKHSLADTLERTGPEPELETQFVYQEAPRGLGDAILCAERAALDGPVAVILPDDLIFPATSMMDMVDAYDAGRAEMMIAAMEVPERHIGRYGAFATTERDGPILQATGIIEKPAPDQVPSLFAAVGRYILPPEIFQAIKSVEPGHGGEIQLTDAIAALVDSHGLEGYLFDGKRFDCGTHEGLLQASNWRRSDVSGRGDGADLSHTPLHPVARGHGATNA